MRTKERLGLWLSAIVYACMATTSNQGADARARETARSRADAVLAGFATPGHPGCAVGVYQDGRVIYEGAYGLANLEHGVPIDPQLTVFDLASVSKQFAAASILLLAHDGKLALDDDIRRYLPEIPDYGHVITIDHLLHQTSGLRDFTALRWMMGSSRWDYTAGQDTLALIANQRGLNFSPGSKYAYSNTNYFLLAQIVHRASGQTLAEFAHERIFAPLGMDHTYFSDDLGRVTPHHASGCALTRDGAFETRTPHAMEYGHSGVQSTVSDLARWQRNFDEPTVGGAWLVQQLEQRGVLTDGTRIEYARGVEVFDEGSGYQGLRTVVHGGATWDGFRSDLMRLTGDRFSIAVLCNSDAQAPFEVRNPLVDIFMEGRFPDLPQPAETYPEPDPNTLAPIGDVPSNMIGLYWNREDLTTRRIELSDGKLWYVRSPDSRSQLIPIGNGQFHMLGRPIRTIVELLPLNGGPQVLRVVGGATTTLEHVEPFSTAANALSEYAGVYTNPELGNGRIVLAVSDGRLVPVASLEEIVALNPIFRDAFDVEGEALMVFQRDASGRVTSLVLDHERARNIVFTRVSE